MKSDLLPQEPLQTLEYAADPNTAIEPVPAPEPPPPATWLRVLVSTLLIVGILGVAAIIADVMVKSRPVASQTPTIIPPTLVESQVIEAKDVREVFLGYGTARADRSVVVSAEVAGLLVEVAEEIEDGSRIEKGDLLARVDDRTYRNQWERSRSLIADVDAKLARLDVEEENASRLIEIAKRELEVNQSEYERLVDLRDRNSASKKEVDFARLAMEQSRRTLQSQQNLLDLIPSQRAELIATRKTREVDIELAQLEVERSTIRSPMSGQVERIFVETGNHVMRGTEIARIVNTDHIEIPIELPMGVRPKTQIGASATLSIETAPDFEWRAKVVRLAPMADGTSRTFLAYLEVDNREQEVPLVPGVFLTARVSGGMIRDALVVPRGAMVEGHVFVANDGSAHRKKVHVKTLIGDEAVVTGELQSGDRLITSNLDILHDGASIRVEADVLLPNESSEASSTGSDA